MAIAAKRYLDRGLAALRSGDHATAVEALTSAGQLVPAYAPVSQWLVVAHARAGALNEAVAVAQQALARAPGQRDAMWLWLLLAEALLAAGRVRPAAEAYDQVAAMLAADAQADVRVRLAMGRARIAAAQRQWPAVVDALLGRAR
ncbi:MAG: tetratricopeptide repeat protein [Myxococcales bacterium]|nr:tetratricopeptide repeat protein [Myxococcales bacterium]